MKIKIKKEYLTLVPRPQADQYQTLLQSMKEDGQHLPIIVNEKGYILDGYTRHQACKELKIEPKWEIRKFPSVEDEKRFVIIVNLSRRQLNMFQKAEVLFSWWQKEKAEGWARRGSNKARRKAGKKSIIKIRLNIRLSKMLGCQHSTACKIMTVIAEADDRLKAQCRNGTITITTAFRKMRNIEPVSTRGYLKYPICLVCKARTIPADDCHVHTMLCCSKCEWGR